MAKTEPLLDYQPGTEMYLEPLERIAKTLVGGSITFLIGAGMSGESGVDIGSKLAQRMLRQAALGPLTSSREDISDDPRVVGLDKLAAQYPFEAVAEFLRTKLDYQYLADWLRQDGGLAKAPPSAAHARLHDLYTLFPHRFPKMLFTTNFDTLLEKQFDQAAIGVTSENLIDLKRAREERRIAIVHLHGSIDYPKSIVSGELAQTTLEGPMFDLLRGALATEVLVMVGYSLTDIDLRRVFFDVQRIAETRQGIQKRTFSVSPASGSPAVPWTDAALAQDIWKQRGVTHIAMGASDFFEALFQVVDSFRTVQMKAAVAKALGVTILTLESMLQSAAEPFDSIEALDLLIYLFYTLAPEGEGL